MYLCEHLQDKVSSTKSFICQKAFGLVVRQKISLNDLFSGAKNIDHRLSNELAILNEGNVRIFHALTVFIILNVIFVRGQKWRMRKSSINAFFSRKFVYSN